MWTNRSSPLLAPQPVLWGVRHSGDIFIHSIQHIRQHNRLPLLDIGRYSDVEDPEENEVDETSLEIQQDQATIPTELATILPVQPNLITNQHISPPNIPTEQADIASNSPMIEQPNALSRQDQPSSSILPDELNIPHDKESTENQHNVSDNANTAKVIDRQPDNTEPLVEYQLNDKTKRLFQQLKEIDLQFNSIELYKQKEERLNVSEDIYYCKNLFLKDRRGKYYLVICHEDVSVDLKVLKKQLDAYRNFNFVGGDEMTGILQVEPGGVTPLALMYHSANHVQMVIHNSLLPKHDNCSLMFHPLDSNLAIQMFTDSLIRFLKHFNHSIKTVK